MSSFLPSCPFTLFSLFVRLLLRCVALFFSTYRVRVLGYLHLLGKEITIPAKERARYNRSREPGFGISWCWKCDSFLPSKHFTFYLGGIVGREMSGGIGKQYFMTG